MTIAFNCSECAAPLKVADTFAGKKCKCPKCATVNEVPNGEEGVSEKPKSKKSATTGVAAEAGKKKAKVADEEPADEEFEELKGKKGKEGKKAKGKKNNKMLLIGGGVAAAALLLFTCMCGGGGATLYFGFPEYLPAFLGGQPSELRYMPTGTTSIHYEHIEQGRNSKISKEVEAALPNTGQKGDGDESLYGIPSSNLDCKLEGGSSSGSVTVLTTLSSVKKEDIESKLKSKNAQLEFEDEKVGSYTIRKAKNLGSISFCVVSGKTVVYSHDPKTLKAVLDRDKMPEFSKDMQAAMKKANFNKTMTSVSVRGDVKEIGGKAVPEWTITEMDFGSDLKVRTVSEYKDKDAAADAKKKAEDDFLKQKAEMERLGLGGEIQESVSVSGTTLTIEGRVTSKGMTGRMKQK